MLLFSHSVGSDSCDPMDCSMPGLPVLHHHIALLLFICIRIEYRSQQGGYLSNGRNLERAHSVQFSSVQSLSRVQLCDPMNHSMPGLPVYHQLPESTQTHVHWVGDAIQPSHPLLLLPSIFPIIRVFSNESALYIKWPQYWSFSFNISPSNKHSGLISFRMDWLDPLAVPGTLKSLLQHHSSKVSILRRSAFFIVQLSHPYMTTGKTIALTRRPFVSKVMSPLFNRLSRLVITFLPRSKRLLISWLQSPSAVIWSALK